MIIKVLIETNRHFILQTQRFEYELGYIYFSLNEYSISLYYSKDIVEKNGEYVPIGNGETFSIFPDEQSSVTKNIKAYWRGIEIHISEDQYSHKEYIEMCFPSYYDLPFTHRFYVSKEQAELILDYYMQFQKKKKEEREKTLNSITTENLEIAENLISGYLENELFDSRILRLLNSYSLEILNQDWKSDEINRYDGSSIMKEKEKKKHKEHFNQLLTSYSYVKQFFENFTEMIIDSNKVNIYEAYAIAWEALRQKSIQIYASHWEDVYSIFLNESIEEIKERVTGYEKAKSEYIKTVLTCEDISIEEAKGYLIYFLASKEPIEILNMGVYFQECEKLIQDIQLEIKNNEIKNMLRTKQIKRKKKYTLDDIDLMSGTEFEEFVSTLFRQMGYNTKITQTTGDQGIDVIAVKNGVKLGIQAKCYTNTVGNSAVQEAVAGKGYYSCDKVMVITNNYFTSSASSLAQSNNVVLWDRDFLKMKLKEVFS